MPTFNLPRSVITGRVNYCGNGFAMTAAAVYYSCRIDSWTLALAWSADIRIIIHMSGTFITASLHRFCSIQLYTDNIDRIPAPLYLRTLQRYTNPILLSF